MTNKTAFAKGWKIEVNGVCINVQAESHLQHLRKRGTLPSILDR